MCHFKKTVVGSFLLICAMALNGCWKPSKKDDPNNGKTENEATASFHVVSVKGEVVTPRSEGTSWKIPLQKEIFVTACVVDRKANSEIRGHKFTVESVENGTRQQGLVTTEKGCFKWKEILPYNYLAVRPTYIEYTRRIYGEGVHVGFRDVHLAIYPWSGDRNDRYPPVVYLKTDQVSATQIVSQEMAKKALEGRLDGKKAQLWISDISPLITLKDESDESLRAEVDRDLGRKDARGAIKSNESGALLEMLLSMRPKIRLEGLDGNPNYVDLKSGDFNIWVQLLANDVGENRSGKILLTPSLIPGQGRIADSKMETLVKMGLTRRVTRGRLELAIKVVPVGLGVDFKPFEAVYVLGDITRILGSQRPQLKPEVYEKEGAFDYASYIASSDNYTELKDRQEARDFEPFIYETANVMFTGVRPGETATIRTVEYKVRTCVRDALSGERVQNQRFRVFDEESGKELLYKDNTGRSVPPMTDQEGCLFWTSSLTHQYYQVEEFYFPKFRIVHQRSTGGQEKGHIKELVMNPWDAMFRTFGFDRIEFTKDFIDSVRTRKKIPSRFFIPRFSYHAIRFRYEIDRYMELEVKKQILLNLRPEVLRYSGIIGGRKVTEALRDGIWLMNVAIQKDYLDPADKDNFLMPGRNSRGQYTTILKQGRNATPKHFVTVVRKLVRVNGGEINTPVEFSVQDLRLMRIRSQFLVQLVPVDEQKLLMANVLDKESRERFKLYEKEKSLTDEQRREWIEKNRAHMEEVTAKLKEELTNRKTGLIDVERLANLPLESVEQFDLTKAMTKEMAEALVVNDFTISDAAPVITLETLVEKNSGLEPRTFVGPIIFLSNAYGDDMRPTDNLDEARCQVSDCDEFKTREIEGKKFRNTYDTSKYFGSVADLARAQVNKEIFDDYRVEKERYKALMPLVSSIANFAGLYNLKFTTLGKEKLTKFDWSCTGGIERCTRPATDIQIDIDRLTADMNEGQGEYASFNQLRDFTLESYFGRRQWPKFDLDRRITREDWKKLAMGSLEIDSNPHVRVISNVLGDKLCRMYAINLGQALDPGLDVMVRKSVYEKCFKAIILSNGTNDAPFIIDHKVRVYETGEYVYKGGKQLNLNISSNLNLSHNYSFGVSFGGGINFMEFPFIGTLASSTLRGLGVSERGSTGWTKPLSLKVGADMGASRSRSDGTGISEGTYLVMQAANFAIQLTNYERCAVVKMDPSIAQSQATSLRFLVKSAEQTSQVYAAAHKGLIVCSGEPETKPWGVTESYFYFTQHFTEGDMLDQADLYNHPWLLAMRGFRDFYTFVRLIRAQEFTLFEPFTKIVDKPGWPLDQMVDAYRAVQPTFPGLYTVLKGGEPLKEYPFDQPPEQLFVR